MGELREGEAGAEERDAKNQINIHLFSEFLHPLPLFMLIDIPVSSNCIQLYHNPI